MACTSRPTSVDRAAGNDAAQRHADVGVGTAGVAVAAITTPMKAKDEPR
jgi:hypothetical protein